MPSFLPLLTRAGDQFAAELRQTCQTLLAHARDPQIKTLLEGEDVVFLNQSFPPPTALAGPGWASLRDLLAPDAAADGALPAARFASTQTTATLSWVTPPPVIAAPYVSL